MSKHTQPGRPYRVVFVIEAMQGGVREHILQLLFALKERGWDARLVLTPEMADPSFQVVRPQLCAAGIDVYPLRMKHFPFSPVNALAIVSLARLLRKLQPDVVHTHCAIGGSIGRMAAWMTGIKEVIYSPHGGSFHEHYGLIGLFYAAVERTLATRTRAIILNSEWHQSRCISVLGSIDGQMFVIPLGIDVARFAPVGENTRVAARKTLSIDPDATLFLCAALLRKIKGQDILLRAFHHVHERNPRARLLVVGEGETRRELEDFVQRLGIGSAVCLTGFVSDVSPYLQAADVFVLPSRGESASYALMEAMASNLPVVATRVGGIPEIVEDGRTGLLVHSEDWRAMAAAMEQLAERPELRRSFGQAGRERVLAHFRVENMIESTDALYRRCLGTEKGALRERA